MLVWPHIFGCLLFGLIRALHLPMSHEKRRYCQRGRGKPSENMRRGLHSLLSAAGAGCEMKHCGEAGLLRDNLHGDDLMKCKRNEDAGEEAVLDGACCSTLPWAAQLPLFLPHCARNQSDVRLCWRSFHRQCTENNRMNIVIVWFSQHRLSFRAYAASPIVSQTRHDRSC